MITLRGHHIEALAEILAKQKGYFYFERGKSPEQLMLEQFEARFRATYGEQAYQEMKAKNEADKKDSYYAKLDKQSEEKARVLDPIENQWLSQPNLEVMAVIGPDSLCEVCPNSDCSSKRAGVLKEIHVEQDNSALQEYGISQDKPYTMKELIQIFRDYMRTNQFPSPRTRNGFGRADYDTVVRDLNKLEEAA